jgi:hypothetical protein
MEVHMREDGSQFPGCVFYGVCPHTGILAHQIVGREPELGEDIYGEVGVEIECSEHEDEYYEIEYHQYHGVHGAFFVDQVDAECYGDQDQNVDY